MLLGKKKIIVGLPYQNKSKPMGIIDVVRTTTMAMAGNRMLKAMPVEFPGLRGYSNQIDGVEMNREVNLKGLSGERIEVGGKDKAVTN